MGKEQKLPVDILGEVASSGRTKEVQAPDNSRTKEGQANDKEPMRKHQIRIDEITWNKIKIYCDDRRLSISAFIRIATKEYMDKQGL